MILILTIFCNGSSKYRRYKYYTSMFSCIPLVKKGGLSLCSIFNISSHATTYSLFSSSVDTSSFVSKLGYGLGELVEKFISLSGMINSLDRVLIIMRYVFPQKQGPTISVRLFLLLSTTSFSFLTCFLCLRFV